MSKEFRLVLIWLACGTLAYMLALVWLPAAVLDGHYIPMGYDSFYHARRILDTIANAGAIYQFDPRIHAPEGSWLAWPWGYDWGMAQITRVVLFFTGPRDPMSILDFIPPTWVFVNVALILAVASTLDLSLPLRTLAGLCFAVSPLTQGLHGVGMLDHHYAELTCILLALWLGLRWFKRRDMVSAAMVGLALGVAPVIHNGLFILQVPVLAALLLQWWRGNGPTKAEIIAFDVTLLATTALILLPSAPFRRGFFDYYLLSWFHLYVAACTAVVAFYLSWWRFNRPRLGGLILLGLLLSLPAAAQLHQGLAFIGGKTFMLDTTRESMSMWQILVGRRMSLMQMTALYSALVWTTPLVLAWAGWRVWSGDGQQVFLGVFVLFGVALLLFQFRFHYYGSFALYLPALYEVDRYMRRVPRRRNAIAAAVAAVLAAAYLPCYGQLTSPPAPALDADYPLMRPTYLALGRLCAVHAGVVLANMNDGHYITYHTRCSVIADNFIQSPQDFRKLRETNRLFRMSPDELAHTAPWINYVLVRVFRSDQVRGDLPRVDLRRWLLRPTAYHDKYFVPVFQSRYEIPVGREHLPLARIYRIRR